MEQPGDIEIRSTKMFKTIRYGRLVGLSENSTGGAGSSVVTNVVKKTFVKVKSKESGNFVKSMKNDDKQDPKTYATILCSAEGCEKKFKFRHGLLRHRRSVHLGVKLHKCEEGNCHSCFFRREELDNHLRKNHGYPMLECDEVECEVKFYSYGGLSRHKKKHC